MQDLATRPAASLLLDTIADVLGQVSVAQIECALILPAAPLARWTHGYAASGSATGDEEPMRVWAEIRRRYPHAASFPLGPVAERAVKRYVARVVQLVGNDQSGDRSRRLANLSLLRRLHPYLAYFLFETAMLNLRGSSEDAEQDFGFAYHWDPTGHWRTMAEEAGLRARLSTACPALAARVLKTWLAVKSGQRICPSRADARQTG